MDFFSNVFTRAVSTIQGEFGIAVIVIVGVLIGAYVYLKSVK